MRDIAPNQADDRTHEIRIGLVLYGGVSLAIYIYGVVFEFWRLLRAAEGVEKNAYARLLNANRASLTVDIVSGASAGGINGVLLAKALANGDDFGACRRLWVERGDIGLLLRDPGEREPRSLLRSDLFDESLRSGLADMARGGTGKALVPALDLFVPATRLRGWVRRFKDVSGQVIDTRQHRKVFHLKFRTQGYNPKAPQLGYDHNDFDSRNNELLAEIARATSAFPFAFEPKLIRRRDERDRRDPRFSREEPDAEYFADGGILDNRPFTEAISTIATRESYRPVRRWLVSVEPDPIPTPIEEPPGPEPEVIEVVRKALSGIPRHESIAGDLDRLAEHQSRVRGLNELTDALNDHLTEIVSNMPDDANVLEFLTRQALYKSYETLRQQTLTTQLVDRLLGCAGLDEENREAVSEPVREHLESLPDLTVIDVGFERRRVRRLLETFGRATRDRHVPELEEPRQLLWALLARMDELEWQVFGRDSKTAKSLAQLQGRPPGAVAEAVRTAMPAVRGQLADGLARIRALVQPSMKKMEESLGASGLGELDFLFRWYPLWDLYLLPLERVAGGSRDEIRFYNLSPNAATYIRKSKEEKLAGDTLGHFGGFVRREWRDNDILWGRLDAAETIVDIVLHDPEKRDPQRVELIEAIQREIADDELPDLQGDYRFHLERNYNVGSENLSAVPMEERADLGLRGARVLRNVLRRLEHGEFKGPSAAPLRSLFGMFGRMLGVALLVVTWPVRAVWGRDPAVRRFAQLAIVFAAAWAVITAALDGFGLIEVQGAVWYAIAIALAAFLAFTLLLWVSHRTARAFDSGSSAAAGPVPPPTAEATADAGGETSTKA